MKRYENAIFECHRSYLNKCKTPGKKDKDGSKSKKATKKGGDSDKIEDVNGRKSNSNKEQQKPITDEEDEQEHFMDDTDSDLEIASSTYTTGDGSTPRSVTPQQGMAEAMITALTAPTYSPRPETPSTAKATLSTPFPPLTAENLENRRKIMDEAQKIGGDELCPPEQGVEVAEEQGMNEEEEALSSGDDGQLKMSPLDNLKKMGEAGRLVQQIPPERRLTQRIDFQVQPWMLDKSYWSMLKSHFSYWANLDVAAFLLNAIYPPPLEVVGVVKP